MAIIYLSYLLLIIIVIFNGYSTAKILHLNRYIFFKNKKVLNQVFYLANIVTFILLAELQRHFIETFTKLWVALLIILIARIGTSAYFFRSRLLKWHKTIDSSSLLDFIAGNKLVLHFVSILIPVAISLLTVGLLYYSLKYIYSGNF